MSRHTYEIKDYDEFLEHTRTVVFKFFGESQQEPNQDNISEVLVSVDGSDREEMDQFLSKSECDLIARTHLKIRKSKSGKERYFLNDQILHQMIESFNSRMLSNILNSLVNKGELETAFDTEIQDFVFWIKDDQEKNQTPETD